MPGKSIEKMIVSANQPYFSPFPGFFYKAHLSDIFVILDNVQFPRGTTWITRNRFKNDQGTLWMTVPVKKKGLGLQRIDDVRICYDGRWAKKHLESLKSAYSNAPYYKEHMDFARELFASNIEKLIDANLMIISYLMKCIRIDTKIIRLSELGIQAKGELLLMELCKSLGASRFLVQSAAKKYLNPDRFKAEGIGLVDIKLPALVYPQLWGNFIPNLSAFDLILNCGPKAHDILFAS